MNLKRFTSEDALEKLQEVIEYDIPEYASDETYIELCDMVKLDYYDAPEDLIDEEMLIDMVKDALNDGWLSKAKNLLSNINLNADYWRLDGNGWAVDIDKGDCEYLKKEIMDELEDQLDDKDAKKWVKIKKKYGLI